MRYDRRGASGSVRGRSPRDGSSNLGELNTVPTRTGTLCAVFAFALTGAGGANAQDAAAGETLYQSVCKNCHGPTAKGMASFPKLAGNTAEYLSTRLERYRAGEKVGPNTALMRPHAKELSDEDIAALAEYIATAFE